MKNRRRCWIGVCLSMPAVLAATAAAAAADLTVHSALAQKNGYPNTTTATTALDGKADPAKTGSVLVAGNPATLNAAAGTWTASGVALFPGINRILVQAMDAGGKEVDRSAIDIWYDKGSVTTVAGATLTADTTWTAENGPYRLTGSVTVPSGKTLTIKPGATLYLNSGVKITVSGKLIAQGTEYARIRFTRYPGGTNWSGIVFSSTYQTNEISCTDLEYGDGGSQCIQVKDSQLTFDRCTILNSGKKHFDITNPQLTIRHSTFGSYKNGTHMFTSACMPANGWLIFDGNLVGICQGSGDVDTFHLDHLSVKGAGNPVAYFINNVFIGAGDDILDDNETDTHIEGNFFANAGVENETAGVAAAVTTGPGACGTSNEGTQHMTVVRNVFYKNNYGIIEKTGSFSTIYNCIFLQNTRGAIVFDEPNRSDAGPAREAYVESCIFWKNPADDDSKGNGTFVYIQSTRPNSVPTQLAVNNSLVNTKYMKYGTGNVAAETADPKFVHEDTIVLPDPANPRYATGFDGFDAQMDILLSEGLLDLHLGAGSSCIGTGYNGEDMGFYVPESASITGVPASPTTQREAHLTVGGLDIDGYKYKVDGPGFDGSWSPMRMDWKTVKQITRSGTTATATTDLAHGFSNGDVIEVIGAGPGAPLEGTQPAPTPARSDTPKYNGLFTISGVTATTFSYTVQGSPENQAAPQDIWCRKPQKIDLTGLADGTYTVSVARRNTMGVWQADADATTGTWTVSSVPGPAIATVDPVQGLPGATVTITGGNFQAGIKVLFGSTESPSVTVGGADTLTAVVPEMAAGSAPITLRNPDGGVSGEAPFTVLARPRFIRGDANLDSSIDLTDPLAILFHLFAGASLNCLAAGDADLNGEVEVTDVIYFLTYLFLGGPQPPAPFPTPGPDPDPANSPGCAAGL